MKAVLVDDEPLALEVLEMMLEKTPNIEVVGKYTNPLTMIEEIDQIEVDVLFLDMEMGIIHGLDVSRILKEKHPHVDILFVTAYPQFAVEAFEVEAVDYLLKPIRFDRLQRAVEKITRNRLQTIEEELENEVTIKVMDSFRLFDKEQKEVKWRTRKAKELLAFLWHHRENPLNRFQIIEELWPDIDEEKATSLMHTTVYQLRRTLKSIGFDSAVSFSNDQYRIDLPVMSDLDNLSKLFQRKQNKTTVEQAMTLYQSGYLMTEDYSWAMAKQLEVKKQFINYLEMYCANFRLEKEENLFLEKCLLKLIELDMYNEDNMFQLLTYYEHINDVTNFIYNYNNYEQILQDDLNIPIPSNIQYLYTTYIVKNKRSAR